MLTIQKIPSIRVRCLVGLRPFGASTIQVERSNYAHSLYDIKSHAELVSIADVSLNYGQRTMGTFFVNIP